MSPLVQSALIRAGRTFLQVFLGIYLAAFAGDLSDTGLVRLYDLSLVAKAAAAGLIAVLALLHRAVLDPSPVPSLVDPAPTAGTNRPT